MLPWTQTPSTLTDAAFIRLIANWLYPGVTAIQDFHTIHDRSGGWTDNPRLSAHPCPNRADVRSECWQSRGGPSYQVVTSKMAAEAAHCRELVDGRWRQGHRIHFSPLSWKISRMSTEFLQTGKASVSVWILVTPLKSVTCGSTQKVTSVPWPDHMAAVDLTTSGLPLFFMEAMLGSHQACCWQLAVFSPRHTFKLKCLSQTNPVLERSISELLTFFTGFDRRGPCKHAVPEWSQWQTLQQK